MTIYAPWLWPTTWRYRRKLRKLNEQNDRLTAQLAKMRGDVDALRATRAANNAIRADALFNVEFAYAAKVNEIIVPNDCTPEKLQDPVYAAYIKGLNDQRRAQMDAVLADARRALAPL